VHLMTMLYGAYLFISYIIITINRKRIIAESFRLLLSFHSSIMFEFLIPTQFVIFPFSIADAGGSVMTIVLIHQLLY